jgi:hypothetical protein
MFTQYWPSSKYEVQEHSFRCPAGIICLVTYRQTIPRRTQTSLSVTCGCNALALKLKRKLSETADGTEPKLMTKRLLKGGTFCERNYNHIQTNVHDFALQT